MLQTAKKNVNFPEVKAGIEAKIPLFFLLMPTNQEKDPYKKCRAGDYERPGYHVPLE